MPKMLPYQLSNLATLISLLIVLPDASYNHDVYGHAYASPDVHPNDGCALGLAMANASKFTVPVPESERNAFQRLLGLNKFRKARPVIDGVDNMYQFPKDFAAAAFGAGAFASLFDIDAYRPEVRYPEDVTKNMVLARLMQVRKTGTLPVAA